MKERILLVNNISGTELIRTLARFDSRQFLLRVMSSAELAREGLIRSGKALNETFLSRNEEVYIIDRFIKENAYFKVSSFLDSNNLAAALYRMRMMVKEDEEKTVIGTLASGEFKDKNRALSEIYLKYTAFLKDNGLIDSIGLIRKAIEVSDKIDSEFIILKEYPIEPLERKLIGTLSVNEVKEISVLELFGKEEKKIKIDEYVSAYGTVNELEDLLSFIYKKKIPFDKCLIVTPKDSYKQYIRNLEMAYDLPITYGGGLSITNSSAFILLKQITDHRNNEYGIDTLRALLTGSLIDREKLLADIKAEEKDLESIIEIAGSLRLSFEDQVNDLRYERFEPVALNDRYKQRHVGSIEKLKGIFNKGLVSFIKEYAVIRNGLDLAGLNVVCNSVEEYLEKVGGDIEELLPVLSRRYVAGEISKEGYLHVSDIRSAASCLREYVFIVGLSSELFPGLPKENYLLLDSDVVLFDENGHTSGNVILDRINSLNDLLRTAGSLGCHIRMSFSSFNIASLKDENPSSFIYDTYKKEYPDKDYDAYLKAFTKASYFDHGLKRNEELGKAYIEGKQIRIPEKETAVEGTLPDIDKRFSPTQILTYFSCPRRFYLNYVLGIEALEEDDPYSIISPKDSGIIYHELMERKANNDISFDEFMSLSEKAFDEYMDTRPEIHEDARERAREDFLDMCEKGYRQDPGNEVIASEKREYCDCYGVKLKGFPDRIEKDPQGKYLIPDFKTGRNLEHDADDPVSCLQFLLYAYMTEKETGHEVSYCEYRYPRLDTIVRCEYDDDNKNELAACMVQFRHALKTNNFPCAEKEEQKEACRYCHYAAICGKEEEGEDDE